MNARPIRRDRPGAALLLTLGILALLGVLTTLLVGAMRERLVFHARREAAGALLDLARSGLAATVAGLAENAAVDGAVHAPRPVSPAAWRDATDLAAAQGATLAVDILDESGRFPLRTHDAALLAGLLRRVGVTRLRAEELGAEMARINRAAPGAHPALTADDLARLPEFADVFTDGSGAPAARLAAFLSLVSEHTENDRPNVNGAPPEVLACLAASAGEHADGPWSAPGRGVFRSADAWVRAGAPDAVAARAAFTASVLRVRVTAARAGISRSLCCLVRVRGGAVRAETPTTGE